MVRKLGFLEKISKKILCRAKNILFRNKLIMLMLDNRIRVTPSGTPAGGISICIHPILSKEKTILERSNTQMILGR